MKPVKNTSPGIPYRIGDIITPYPKHGCTYEILKLDGKNCDRQMYGCKICYNNQKLARLYCSQLHTSGWYCLQEVDHPWIILERRTNEAR